VSLEDLENYHFEAQAARAQLETASDERHSLAAVSPRAELGARKAHPVSGDGIGPGEGFSGSRSPSFRPPTPQGSSSRRVPPDPSAAVAYAAQPKFPLTFRQQPQLRLLSLC
jgi:hypothetical protein